MAPDPASRRARAGVERRRPPAPTSAVSPCLIRASARPSFKNAPFAYTIVPPVSPAWPAARPLNLPSNKAALLSIAVSTISNRQARRRVHLDLDARRERGAGGRASLRSRCAPARGPSRTSRASPTSLTSNNLAVRARPGPEALGGCHRRAECCERGAPEANHPERRPAGNASRQQEPAQRRPRPRAPVPRPPAPRDAPLNRLAPRPRPAMTAPPRATTP